MNILVCIKRILDPEIPPVKFKLDTEAMKVVPPEGIQPVINPYDERAVELALRLKQNSNAKITVVTLDQEADSGVVRHVLSMGADEGIILADEKFEGSDSFSIAYILSRAIQKIGTVDLVLCGRQAADWEEGMVGPILAETLGFSLVTLAENITVSGGDLKVKRVTLNGYQVISVPLPAVVTVSDEVGQPRLPSGWGIVSASRRQIPVWRAQDIAADPARIGATAARKRLVKLFVPEQTRKCEIVEGETTQEAAAKLAERLFEAGVLKFS